MIEQSFQNLLTKAKVGDEIFYHQGHLAHDREHSTALHVIALLAMGLKMIGAVDLCQRRLRANITEYYVRVLRPIRPVDFDHGRKTYLAALED